MPAAGREAGWRAGSSTEARSHKGAGGTTGPALCWVGFVKSWPVSRKPSSCPEASEGPNSSPQSPESEPCVLRVQRCPTAPSKLCQLRRLCRHHAQDGECRGWALLAPEALADLCSPLKMAWGVGQPPAGSGCRALSQGLGWGGVEVETWYVAPSCGGRG